MNSSDCYVIYLSWKSDYKAEIIDLFSFFRIKPASKKSTKYQMSYGQIRYLMKRLSTALDSKLKQGRPPKYCRMCHRELRKLIGSQLERRSLEKKYMKGRNITEQRCDKRKNFSAKENSKARKCSPLSSVAAKEVHANNKTE